MDVPRILDAISSPADLKVLDNEELAILAREIRQEIVATTSVTGGHVASSLGAVDIIVALESLLDMPRDRVVFDVGHQAYAHKLLTGRREAFKTLRTYGGLSGFTKPSESPYDVHPSGHASDSLSIATGLAKARQLKGTDEKVVALIGDASLAGGMAFEALNYMGNEQLPLVVILNDNEMSISRNVGALMKHLGNIRANSHYREAREGLQAAMEQGGRQARGCSASARIRRNPHKMVIPHTMIYESPGIAHRAHRWPQHRRAARRFIARAGNGRPGPLHVVAQRRGLLSPPAGDLPRRPTHRFAIQAPRPCAEEARRAPPATLRHPVRRSPTRRPTTRRGGHHGGYDLAHGPEDFVAEFLPVRGRGHRRRSRHGGHGGRLLSSGGKSPWWRCTHLSCSEPTGAIIDVALPEANVVFADRAGLAGDDGPTHHGVLTW